MSENNSHNGIDKDDFGCFYTLGSVCSAMDMGLDLYRAEREEYLHTVFSKLNLDSKDLLKRIETTAKILVEGAGDLPSLDCVGLPKIFSDLAHGKNFRLHDNLMHEALLEGVEYLVSCELLRIGEDSTERVWKLLLLAQPVSPSSRAASFLKRVSRCYIYGFDPECVVMCRGVLDAEFEAEISTDLCIDVVGARRRRPKINGHPLFTLNERIIVAEKTDSISKETAKKAHEVRKAGRDVVHKWPKVPKAFGDSFRIIGKTLTVIRELRDRPIET
ncbi:MAG: hypothetical protein KAT11_02495 [Phycisphaerae bacterium]|nr:hypothetical protein [Phycisphaerae bacterium]